MDLPVADGSDHVTARGGVRARALEREPRLGCVELGARGVEDDRELAGLDPEPPLELPTGVLELREHALRVLRVALVVARDERLGGGLDPAHAPVP